MTGDLAPGLEVFGRIVQGVMRRFDMVGPGPDGANWEQHVDELEKISQ